MATVNTKILTAEQEAELRQPIDEYVGSIQEKINALREEGTDRVIELQNSLDSLKRDRIYTQQEKAQKTVQYTKELEKAKEHAERTQPEKKPSIRERLAAAKQECAKQQPRPAPEKKPPELGER